MRTGDCVQVRAYHSDGASYRWWTSTVEVVETDSVVLVAPVGHRVEGTEGGWTSEYAIRSYYWADRSYSLLEVYSADGSLVEIYVNINSPAEILDSMIRFIDYELDVSRRPPQAARIVDEDEFAKASSRFGYSEEFQSTCYELAKQAVSLADRWVAKGMPTSPSSQ